MKSTMTRFLLSASALLCACSLSAQDNILDAHGIRKITDLTTQQNVNTNELRQAERKAIKKQDVEAQETILALERQRVEAVEKQQREIAEITAREQASAKKVQEEQRLEAERARIGTEEEIGVAEENKSRQILVAQRNKEKNRITGGGDKDGEVLESDEERRKRMERERLYDKMLGIRQNFKDWRQVVFVCSCCHLRCRIYVSIFMFACRTRKTRTRKGKEKQNNLL